ncbi:MAG: hypothetical protein HKN76_07630, partial [Saprospiraceae bacterium]|nr:hypothetical protein [Saprospiraceae bacterium]
MFIRSHAYLKLLFFGFFLFYILGLNGQVNNAIFYGSMEDGYESECYEQVSSNPIFEGGFGDGYATICFEQSTSNDIYSGGIGDGYSSLCFEQPTSNSIFEGSSGDGFIASCFEQSTSNSIFAGSHGDGFSALCYEQSTSNSIFAGSIGDGFSIGCGFLVDDCLVFETAPVDLTKSFDPVNGVKDRVQLKWYKAIPEIRYTDEDAAMCDIKFWKKRVLDPPTGNPIGPVILNPDTILISDRKKTYPDDSPREIFKWPVKYRADGVNNSNRAEPNFRYEWQVRCECGHDGNGIESPWSDIKIFNTPDFDPVTGIYTPPIGQE